MQYLYEIKKLMKSKIFWLSVFINILFIFFNSEVMFESEWSELDLMNQIQNAYWPGLAAFITPVISALPYVTRFHEEKTSGDYRMKITRQGKLSYVFHHVLMGIISGFLVMFLSLALYTGAIYFLSLCTHKAVIYEGITDAFGDADNPTFYSGLQEAGYSKLVYLIHCLFLGLYGAVWAGIGVAASVFIKNKNFALIFPLFVRRLMDYFPVKLFILTPNYLRFEGIEILPAGGFIYAVSYILAVFILGSLCMTWGMNRLLKRQG